MSGIGAALAPALGRLRLPIVALACILAAFMLVPVVVVATVSFTSAEQMAYPPEGFSLCWYDEVLTQAAWRDAFWLSLRVAVGAATLATVGGSLAALGVRRLRREAFWLRTLFVAPIVFPVVAYAVGLYFAFSELDLVGSTLGLVLGLGMLCMPLPFVIVSGALARVPTSISRAAASLGASWPTIVWRIELAMVARAVAVAWLVALVFAFDEFVIALYLTAPDSPTFPLEIYNAATSLVSPAVAAAATLVMAGAVALFMVAGAVGRLSRHGGGP